LAKRAKNYLHHEAQVVLPELLSILGLRQPVLVGHSDGGSIALLYAARFEVTALITIAAHTFVEEITLSGIKEALQIQDKLLPKLRHYHGEKTEALFNAWWQTWLDEDFEDWNITKEVSKVACPTLAIQGEHDEYGTEAQARSIAGNVRGGGQIAMIEGGGHMPHLQFPEKVVGLIRRFLEL
jgi:pimeloyl-ACP methyl ester carboxylesterase